MRFYTDFNNHAFWNCVNFSAKKDTAPKSESAHTLMFTESLHNTHRRALFNIHENIQFVGLLHKQNWAAFTDINLLSFIDPWWKIKRCLRFRRNSNLQLSFLLFGRDTLWRILRKRVERGGKLWSPETLLYPSISNHSAFAMLGKSCYSSTCVKLTVVFRRALDE